MTRGRSDAPGKGCLSIGALSRTTGIPVETLRTWERRYDFPRPARKPSGHRIYDVAAVARLRAVALALSRGHRAADVLPLDEQALQALLELPVAAAAGASPPTGPPSRDIGPVREAGADEAVQGLLSACMRFDSRSLTALLQAGWSRMGPLGFLTDLATPFMQQLGKRWEDGALDIRHEHFASALMSDFLREVRRPFEDRAAGPTVALATLPGDMHALGLEMAAVVYSMCGWRVLYLGTDLPVAEIVLVARDAGARVVGVSASSALPPARAAAALHALRAALPAEVHLVFGGSGGPHDLPPHVERVSDLESLYRRLGKGGPDGMRPDAGVRQSRGEGER